jgi:nicotinate-nucleotide pyrophosphorylase (carboxylating)
LIYDTRKTTPGHRRLEKYAVALGGGRNHRFGLYDQILIKENHIKASGGRSISELLEAARRGSPKGTRVEIEVESLDEFRQALQAGADIIMLDDMTLADIERACQIARGSDSVIEVSGGINLENVGKYAFEGVEMISVGALTHSARPLDMALYVL